MNNLLILTEKELASDFELFSSPENIKYDHKGEFISSISPVDLYCYLSIKFGEPNGLYGRSKKTDINNPMNWQYAFKYKDCNVYIYHHFRELGFFSYSDTVEKFDKTTFLKDIKNEIKNHKKDINNLKNKLRKLQTINNPFKTFYDLCELEKTHIKNLLEEDIKHPEYPKNINDYKNCINQFSKISCNYSNLVSHSITLLCFIPIMIESYIHLIFIALAKNNVRKDDLLFNGFLKCGISEKIKRLPLYCNGFINGNINVKKDTFTEIQKIINIRNDLLHGNFDIKIKSRILEEVYFNDNNIPLFDNNLDFLGSFYNHCFKNNKPDDAIDFFEKATDLFNEVLGNIKEEYRINIEELSKSKFIQYNKHERTLHKKLPDNFRTFISF